MTIPLASAPLHLLFPTFFLLNLGRRPSQASASKEASIGFHEEGRSPDPAIWILTAPWGRPQARSGSVGP